MDAWPRTSRRLPRVAPSGGHQRLGPRRAGCYGKAVPQPYDSPPIVEAVYEVFVQDSPGWSQLSLERIREKVKDQFGGSKDVLEPVGVQVQFGPGKTIAQTMTPEAPRHRLWSSDKSEMFQFSSAMCAYNLLAKYRGFDEHKADLERIVGVYLAEASSTGILWVGQRYINKITLPSSGTNPSEYFLFYPALPPSSSHRPFALQVVTESFEGGSVTLNLAYQDEGPSGADYFLDIYARSKIAVAANAAEVREWQERAHQPVKRAFESALTDKARALFEGRK